MAWEIVGDNAELGDVSRAVRPKSALGRQNTDFLELMLIAYMDLARV